MPERFLIGLKLENSTHLRAECGGYQGGCAVHENRQLHPGERTMAQLSYGFLLADTGANLRLGLFVSRNVASNSLVFKSCPASSNSARIFHS